jgi:hypothetical protein
MATYANPFGGLSPTVTSGLLGRTDEGVDLTGPTGPLRAIGSGTLMNATNSGWNFGGNDAFIVLKLDQPLDGNSYVYYAEDITPAYPSASSNNPVRVTAGQTIGTLGSGGMEIGFATGPPFGASLAGPAYAQKASPQGTAFRKILTGLMSGTQPSGSTGSTSGTGVGAAASNAANAATGGASAVASAVTGSGATGSTGSTGTSGTQDATLTANFASTFISDINGFVTDLAKVINFIFEWFQPGQYTRLAAFFAAAVSGGIVIRLYVTDQSDDHMPTVFALLGVTLIAGYMAFRPWPVGGAGKPIRPAAYIQDIASGQPTQGPQPADMTGDIRTGLYVIIGVWVLNKIAGVASGILGLLTPLLGIFAASDTTQQPGTTAPPPGVTIQ